MRELCVGFQTCGNQFGLPANVDPIPNEGRVGVDRLAVREDLLTGDDYGFAVPI